MMGRLRALVFVVALALLLLASRSSAHAVDVATLTLTEVSAGKFAVDWRTTSSTLEELSQPARYPGACQQRERSLDCGPLGLTGEIEFPWLVGGESRVTVVIDWLSGERLLRTVHGRSPSFKVYGVPASAGLRFLQPIAVDYARLGVEHILLGFDHLMFVLAITLLVQSRKTLVLAISAFTVAHSLTLAASVLGWLSLPVAAVETTIALSIVLACAECLRPPDSLARRAPWLVTFGFGLLHGMGFASALEEAGLPEQHVPSALLFFNLGVELGQLAATVVFLGFVGLLTRLERRRIGSTRTVVYALGSLAAYWSIERALVSFGG